MIEKKKLSLVFLTIILFISLLPIFSNSGVVRADSKIPVVVFTTPGCEECTITRNFLNSLRELYPNMQIIEFSMSDEKNRELLLHFDEAYNVPENLRNTTPAVFIGKHYFVRVSALKNVENAIKNYNYSETEFIENVLNSSSDSSRNNMVEMFKKFGVLTVIGAGLIDGYNPCAFTVLIFFISFLLLKKKTRREILIVGLSFIFGFGLSYFLLGIGLFSVVSKWKYFDDIAKWVYFATAVATLIFAVLTIQDYFRVKRGHAAEMVLQLSGTEKRTIHSLLRNPRVQGTALFSFLVSFPVSIVSFSCTGQTYLPTIVYIYSIPALKTKAALYLILYNIMFVLPLIAIVYFVYMGATSQAVIGWFKKHLAAVKLWTGVVFFILFAYLSFKTMLLFGII
jgi:cytochrome c biogenesis protein CcdA/glutaredoxin